MDDLDTGPIWLEGYDAAGERARLPGWCHMDETGTRVTVTVMTDADDIAFWFGDG